jgi:chromosome segregation ATPase
MVTSTRKAYVVGIVLLALTVAALASPVAADKKDDLQRERRGVNGQLGDAKKSYDQSSRKFASAVAALRKAQSQLDAAEKHLGSTRGQLATAEARDAQMQAELNKTEAELDLAIDRLAEGKQELRASEIRVQQFTVEMLQQGDRGLQAFGDLLRGESPTNSPSG